MARVLILNSEPSARATLQVLLELEGHECGVAETADDASRQMSWQHFDLVVIDTQGVPSSFEFAQKLRSLGNQTPVLFLGTQSSEKSAAKRAKAGAAAVQQVAPGVQLTKPFEVSELLTAINHLTVMNTQRIYASPSLGSGLNRLH